MAPTKAHHQIIVSTSKYFRSIFQKGEHMIQFSIPTALSIFAATSAVAVTSVAVAVPALQPDEVLRSTATPVTSATSTPTATSVPVPEVNSDSPLAEFPDHIVMGGISIHDLPMGFSTHVLPTGVYFSYVGECHGDRPIMKIWGNNGQIKSNGGGYCDSFRPGQIMFAGAGLTWNEDTRNSYCYSPIGAASAYRAEIYGMTSEWIPIPDEFKQCVDGQEPWGPLPPGEQPPAPPVVAPLPEPSPSSTQVTPESTPNPTVSPAP